MNSPVEQHSHDAISNFQPSLAVIVGFLGVVFFVAFFLLFFAKCFRRNLGPQASSNHLALVRSASGLDRTVIESLPFFRFSSLTGKREGLECSVCLSTFEDLEILRLLPKCNHAFHINCVDEWLKSHSSCPLCRCKVNPYDPNHSSKEFLPNQSDLGDDPNTELCVLREASRRGINIGSSFRKILAGIGSKYPELHEESSQTATLHKHNHRIIASGLVLKNSWSSLSCPDSMLLSVEMLNDMSSCRFSPSRIGELDGTKLKEESKIKRLLAPEVIQSSSSVPTYPSILTKQGDRGAISDIVSCRRTANLEESHNLDEEREQRHCLRRTVIWFANSPSTSQQMNTTV